MLSLGIPFKQMEGWKYGQWWKIIIRRYYNRYWNNPALGFAGRDPLKSFGDQKWSLNHVPSEIHIHLHFLVYASPPSSLHPPSLWQSLLLGLVSLSKQWTGWIGLCCWRFRHLATMRESREQHLLKGPQFTKLHQLWEVHSLLSLVTGIFKPAKVRKIKLLDSQTLNSIYFLALVYFA